MNDTTPPVKHTDPLEGSLLIDPWVEARERDLAEAQKSLNGLMKRMSSARNAMEKAQGTDLYTRYAFAFDLISLEYQLAFEKLRGVKQDLFIHRLSESLGYQQQALDCAERMMHDFKARITVLERAFAKMDDPAQFGFEKLKQGYTLGLKRSAEREQQNGAPHGTSEQN